MQFDFPFHLDPQGRTASTSEDDHIRDLIEQVLFTEAGERVNRPSFGCGLLGKVFDPNSQELASATRFIVQGALQQWLGEVIAVEGVEVKADGGKLVVTVRYLVKRDRRRSVAELTREI